MGHVQRPISKSCTIKASVQNGYDDDDGDDDDWLVENDIFHVCTRTSYHVANNHG